MARLREQRACHSIVRAGSGCVEPGVPKAGKGASVPIPRCVWSGAGVRHAQSVMRLDASRAAGAPRHALRRCGKRCGMPRAAHAAKRVSIAAASSKNACRVSW
jgi:hypothetical protein